MGRLEVRDRGRPLTVPGSRPRALLALLALNAGRFMRADRLIELLWADEIPPSAANALQVHISSLRKVLEPQGPPYRLLISERSGYALKIGSDQIDCARFERLAERAHRALERGEIIECVELTSEAIGLWRGSALADMADHAWSVGEARRLEELRMSAEEDRMDAELALGRHVELVPALQALLARDPLRERVSGQLMLALYRSGRQAEASEIYQQTREMLVEQLGMEPGVPLQQLLKAIINQDPSIGVAAQEPPAPRLDNLPAALTSFVGRGRETAKVASLLSQARLLTLTGPGGIGKTRLAVEVARAALGRHEHGVWLINLAPVENPDVVPETVASTLVVRVASGHSATDALIAYLSRRDCLLLLDGCEHLVDASARLTEMLLTACPGVSVMATSREALEVPGEVRWQVPPLDFGGTSESSGALPPRCDAVELFLQRASAATGSIEHDERYLERATELCRRLDGIPLAIELAAAKLNVLSLEELSVRIVNRFQILTGGSRTAPARHQTLQATLDWSYDLLPEVERSLLRKMTVFAGSFTLEAAHAVCGGAAPGGGSLLDGLSGLARKSLVQVDRNGPETRYRLLDTIREYGHARLIEADDWEAVGQHHRNYYLDLAERAAPHLRGPNASFWTARLAREYDNVRVALESSLAAGDADKYSRLLVALWWFWYVRCSFDEGRGWLHIALTDLEPVLPSTRAALLLGAGQLAWAQGDHHTDRVMFEEALSLATALNDDGLVGHALLRLSLADYAAGEMSQAQEHLTNSIHLLRKDGTTSLLAEALNNLGWIRAIELNSVSDAAELLDESLSLARQSGDLWTLQEVLDSVAALKLANGDVDAAEDLQQESLRTCAAIGDVWSLPRILAGFVRIAMVRGQPDKALRVGAAASRLRDEFGLVLMAAEEAQLGPLIESARASLAPDVAETAWRDGLQMSMAAAVDYALAAHAVVDSTAGR